MLRAAVRWGLYHDCWDGEDPTVGVKKFKTKKRKRVSKREEIKKLLAHFERAEPPMPLCIRPKGRYRLLRNRQLVL